MLGIEKKETQCDFCVSEKVVFTDFLRCNYCKQCFDEVYLELKEDE